MRSRCTLRRLLLPVAGWLALGLHPGTAGAVVLAFDIEAAVIGNPASRVALAIQFSTIQDGTHFTDTVSFPGGAGETEVEGTGYAFDASSVGLVGEEFGELSGATLTGGGGPILQRDGVFDADRGIVPDLVSFESTYGTDIGATGTLTITTVIQDPTLALIVPSVVISQTIAPGVVISNTISALLTDPEVFASSDAITKRLFLDFGAGTVISATIETITSRVVSTGIPEPRTPYILMTGLVLLGLMARWKKRGRLVG